MQGLTTAYVDAGGANIDTSTFTVYVNQALLPSGGGGLRKFGAGMVVLNGVDAYSGSTLVSLGTLAVNGSIGAGAASVSPAAALTGTGFVNGPLTVFGTLSSGNGVGTLHTNDAELEPNSVLSMEIAGAGAADLLDVRGKLTLDPGSILNVLLTNGYTPHAGDTF